MPEPSAAPAGPPIANPTNPPSAPNNDIMLHLE